VWREQIAWATLAMWPGPLRWQRRGDSDRAAPQGNSGSSPRASPS